MKKLFYLLSFVFVFASCSTDDTENPTPEEIQEIEVLEIQESTALRISLEKMRAMVATIQPTSKTQLDGLCFQFVYPIVLEYNDGTQISIEDYEQLLEVLLDETMNFHITSIGFPFEVENYTTNSTLNITNETDFQTLIDDCGYDSITVTDVVAIAQNCFTINFPITLFVNDEAQTFNSQTEMEEYFYANYATIHSLDFDYPLSFNLLETGSDIEISNDIDLIYLISSTCGIN